MICYISDMLHMICYISDFKDLGADKKGEQCRYECDGNLCNSSFGAAVSILLFALMSLLSL